MSVIIAKQIKSTIGRPESQVKIMKALGFGKINRVKELKDTESVRGMIKKVAHLIEIVG